MRHHEMVRAIEWYDIVETEARFELKLDRISLGYLWNINTSITGYQVCRVKYTSLL